MCLLQGFLWVQMVFFPFTNKDPVTNDKAILWSAVRYDFMEIGEAS